MATLKGSHEGMQGSIGELTYRVVDGATIVSEKSHPKIVRTEKSMRNRLLMCNVMRMYHQMKPFLHNCLEGCTTPKKLMNRYVQLNKNNSPAFYPKELSQMRCCVVVPHQISAGSLPPIEQRLTPDKQLCTDICITIPIDENTRIHQLVNDILQHNTHFLRSDTLTLYIIRQTIQRSEWGTDYIDIPYASCEAFELPMDCPTDASLSSIIPPTLLCNLGDRLALSEQLNDCAAAFVHSRHNKSGELTVSTQTLICVNPHANQYTTQEALLEAVKSYKGTRRPTLGNSDEHPKHNIVVQSNNEALGVVSGSGLYSEGSTVQLIAAPLAGARFIKWTDLQGHLISTSPAHTVSATHDTAYLAHFEAL